MMFYSHLQKHRHVCPGCGNDVTPSWHADIPGWKVSDASSVGLDILVPSWGLHVNMLHCRESSGMHRYVGVEGLDKPDRCFLNVRWFCFPLLAKAQQFPRQPEPSEVSCWQLFLHTCYCMQMKYQAAACNCSRDRAVVRAPDLWLKGQGFESLQEQWENFLLQGWLFVLTLISTPHTWCMVVSCTWNLRRDSSSFMWHQPCQRFGGYSNSAKKKVSHSCRITCKRSESAQESGV